MSQYRNLRYLTLPSAQEALMLQKLFTSVNSKWTFDHGTDVSQMIVNVIANAVHNDTQIQLSLDDVSTTHVLNVLDHLGLADLIITDEAFRDRPALLSQINRILNNPLVSADTSGSWSRLFGQLDQLSYGDFVMSTSLMGEKPLYSVISEYLDLFTSPMVSDLEHLLRADNFQFTAKEYWHIRGRIKQAAQYHDDHFNDDLVMHDLHPVFFEMYSLDEAEQVIQETTNRLVHQAEMLLNELYNWHDNYRRYTLATQVKYALTCRNDAEQILAEIESISDQSSSGTTRSWFSFGSDTSEHSQSKQREILMAYDHLLGRIDKYHLSDLFELPKTTDIKLISENLSSVLKNYYKIRRQLKRRVDRHLNRLNGHNIDAADYRRLYHQFQEGLNKFLTEINGLQLLKEHIEDNTLDVSSQMQWLRSICAKLGRLRLEVTHFRSYMEWRQFESLLRPEDKEVLQVLMPFNSADWGRMFDQWYLRHFIETQDLLPINYEEAIEKTLKDFELISGSELKNVISKAVDQFKTRLKSLFRQQKTIKTWLNDNVQISTQSESQYIEQLKGCFPVTLTTTHTGTASSVSIIDRDQPGEGGSLDEEMLAPIQYSLPMASPELMKDVLYSDHSDRIHQVRLLAGFLLSNSTHFEVWQNQKQVYFSFMPRQMNQLVLPLLPSNLYAVSVESKDKLDEVIETLLNNHERHFACLFSQELNWSSEHWSQQWHTMRLISLLCRAGMAFQYISWSAIFNSAEIVSFLKRERAASRPAIRI